MFGLVISLTTEYAQPILGVCFALLVGWIWKRDQVLQEIKEGYPELEQSLFWKIWPWYVRVVCPIMMLMVFFA
jgi:NSS family neurotransmitter:Na+ symporter